ncbi:MAG TPA: hypothetical protein VHC22_12290 [Pirellulales bacterium]|nr:hypothetical protein [Pirellulales bacterium]
MTRRFQFSLRAMLLLVAVSALPLAAFGYFRRQPPTISVSRERAGKPVVVRVKFFRPSAGPVLVGITIFGDEQSHPNGCPCMRHLEVKRSFWFFCQAETQMVPSVPGYYQVVAILPDGEVRQDFIVETVE